MAKIVKFTQEQLNGISNRLQSLPQKDDSKNKTEAIKTLAKDIDHALKQGYSLNEICGFLKEGGLNITVTTLKAYLQKTTARKNKTQRDIPGSIKKEAQSSDTNEDSVESTTREEGKTEHVSPPSDGFIVRPDIEDL